MRPTITPEKLEELITKEGIASLYMQSLGKNSTRKTHVLLKPPTSPPNVPWPAPSIHDLELDFASWYGGVIALVTGIDPDLALSSTQEMTEYVAKHFDRAKAAIAA